MEKLFLGVYWPARKETIRSAAERLFEIIHQISKIDNRLGRLKADTTSKALNSELDFNNSDPAVINDLANVILDNRRADIKKYHPGVTPSVDFHEPIGFTQFFSVKEVKKMSFSSIIGWYSAGMTNNFLITFPAKFQYDFNYVYNLFKTIIILTKPDWGVVKSHELEKTVGSQPMPAMPVGWFNFISGKYALKDVQGSIFKENLDGGTLTCTTSQIEIFSSNNPDHIRNVTYLANYFKEKGITRKSF